MTSKSPTIAIMEKAVGSAYTMGTDDQALTLTLVEVTALGSSLREGGGYSLMFSGPADRPVEQGTYELMGNGLDGPTFIVPVGQDDGNLLYEVVFN